MTNTSPARSAVDPEELDRQIAEMYRDVASEADRELHFPTGRSLAEALGYPAHLLDRLPAQSVQSFAGGGYHLGLAELVPGERVLDLGSGSGMDVFAAASLVSPTDLWAACIAGASQQDLYPSNATTAGKASQ